MFSYLYEIVTTVWNNCFAFVTRAAHPKQHDQHSFHQILSELLVADLT